MTAPNARAIIHPRVLAKRVRLSRHPVPELDRFVEYAWVIEWDLTGHPPHVQRVLPSPTVHLSLRPDRDEVTGIRRTFDFTAELSGAGRVLGVRFLPGGARPFLDVPVSALTDRPMPVAALFDVDVAAWHEQVRTAPDPTAAAATVAERLGPLAPPPDPTVAEVTAMVFAVRDDPTLTRVDALAERFDHGVRRLQRLFTEYVGIGPKWVIRCYRLHEVAGRAASGEDVDWPALALALGYSDQAHLIREFTAVVGEPPARYARAATAPSGLGPVRVRDRPGPARR